VRDFLVCPEPVLAQFIVIGFCKKRGATTVCVSHLSPVHTCRKSLCPKKRCCEYPRASAIICCNIETIYYNTAYIVSSPLLVLACAT
jgi:hypothetical protein